MGANKKNRFILSAPPCILAHSKVKQKPRQSLFNEICSIPFLEKMEVKGVIMEQNISLKFCPEKGK